MKYKFLNSIVFFSVIAFFLSSCIKDDLRYTKDDGNTFLKFLEAPEYQLFFSPFTNVVTLDLFSTRKDANSNTSLNTAGTATLTSLPNLIDSFNKKKNTQIELLPDSLYTLLNPAYTKTATGYTLNFAAGKFASDFSIALNGSKWNVSHSYALAFGLSATGENIALNKALDTIIVFLSVKNKYDGIYSYSGTVFRNSATGPDPALSGPFKDLAERSLITLGTTSNSLVPLWASGGGIGGIDNTFITVDPVTNLVTVASKNNASLKNTIGSVNMYDPATKTFTLAFDWGTAPNTRVTTMTLKYVKAR